MNSSQAVHPHYAARQPVPQPQPRRRAVQPSVEPEVRELMIAEAAYYIAERRGFEAGAELDDWLEAESEIDRLLAAVVAQGEEEEEQEVVRSAD